jgi:phage tail-like protein
VSPGDVIGAGPFMLTFEGLEGVTDPQPEPMRQIPLRTVRDFPPQIVSGVVEMAPVTVRPPMPRRTNGASPIESLVPRVKLRENRYPQGFPRDRSNWLQYLPGIFSDPNLDPTHFMGRYLLVFESMFSPIVWMVDNFDLYLSPETAPPDWMQWIAGWFDITLVPELPEERQRAIMRQIGWLFLRRGTKAGLERLLELYFGVKPEIIENADGPLHFVVRLPLSQTNSGLDPEIADRIIASQKPAHTTYTLEIV